MNKQELINAISEATNQSKKDTEAFLTAFTSTVIAEVAKGSKVQLVGFGNWEKQETKGKEGTIQFGDRKGQKWVSEDSYRVSFSAGKQFKDAVKGVVAE